MSAASRFRRTASESGIWVVTVAVSLLALLPLRALGVLHRGPAIDVTIVVLCGVLGVAGYRAVRAVASWSEQGHWFVTLRDDATPRAATDFRVLRIYLGLQDSVSGSRSIDPLRPLLGRLARQRLIRVHEVDPRDDLAGASRVLGEDVVTYLRGPGFDLPEDADHPPVTTRPRARDLDRIVRALEEMS